MIAPRSSSAFVCLRCELRSVRRPIPARLPRTATSSFSTTTYRTRDAFDDHEDAVKAKAAAIRDAERTAKAAKAENGEKNFKDRGKAEDRLAEAEGEQNQVRFRFRKGKKAALEHNVRLEGMKTMGKDAGILVLREFNNKPRRRREEDTEAAGKAGKKNKKKKKGEEEVEEGAPSEPPKVMESLEAAQAPLDEAEVNRLLDEMRPKKRTELGGFVYLNMAEQRALHRKLQKGFTKQQLEGYFISAKEPSASQSWDAEPVPAKGKDKLTRTEWTPGSDTRKPLVDPALALKRKLATKNDLIHAIMREKWHVVLADEVESAGHLALSLKTWQIDLLSAAEATFLDDIAKARKATIAIQRPYTVRITAPKTNAEYAADDIEELIGKTAQGEFHLQYWYPRLDASVEHSVSGIFPKGFEETVAKLSGVRVSVVDDHVLRIRSFRKEALDEARRLLVNMLPLKPDYIRAFEVEKLAELKKQAYYVPVASSAVPQIGPQKASLGRWTKPVPRHLTEPEHDAKGVQDMRTPFSGPAGPPPTSLDAFQKRVHDRVFSTYRGPGYEKSLVVAQMQWPGYPETEFAAIIGQALLPPSASGASAAKLLSTEAAALPDQGFFSSSVPGLPKAFVDAAFTINNFQASTTYLSLDFTPAPGKKEADETLTYPTLEMRFTLGKNPQLRDVRFSFGEKFLDVLLPDRVADVRFRTTQTVRFKKPRGNTDINEFAATVIANIKHGHGKLSAPPGVTLWVPTWSIEGWDAFKASGVDGGLKQKHGFVQVTYMFTGVTHRQNFNATFEDEPVTWSTSHSGAAGGNTNAIGRLTAFCPRQGRYRAAPPPAGMEEAEEAESSSSLDSPEASDPSAPTDSEKPPSSTSPEAPETSSAQHDAATPNAEAPDTGVNENPTSIAFIQRAFRLADLVHRSAANRTSLAKFFSRDRYQARIADARWTNMVNFLRNSTDKMAMDLNKCERSIKRIQEATAGGHQMGVRETEDAHLSWLAGGKGEKGDGVEAVSPGVGRGSRSGEVRRKREGREGLEKAPAMSFLDILDEEIESGEGEEKKSEREE